MAAAVTTAFLAVGWVLFYRAKSPPPERGVAPREWSTWADRAGRAVVATMLTFVVLGLPALILFAVLGGTLA